MGFYSAKCESEEKVEASGLFSGDEEFVRGEYGKSTASLASRASAFKESALQRCSVESLNISVVNPSICLNQNPEVNVFS